MIVECPNPDCGWDGEIMEALPAPDGKLLCPECGEAVVASEPPDQPATEPS